MSLKITRTNLFVLLTLPALIAIAIGLLSPIIVFLEYSYASGKLSPFILQFEASSARSVLTAIAGAAMTALSLTYSLVLVVFTLAAGNIGPRLLKRFTSEMVNQITAGIFGGTFLFSIATLFFIQEQFVPKIAVLAAGFLSILSVLQLIYFVRHVSQSVTVDDEIAEITASLVERFTQLAQSNDNDAKVPDGLKFNHKIISRMTGYVGELDETGLCKVATENALTIKINQSAGSYVLKGEDLAEITRSVSEENEKIIHDSIRVEPSRSAGRLITFSINLLVEIALRALSPGVNDTYTAIAAIDGLSNAFSQVPNFELENRVLTGEDDQVRLVLPTTSLKKLFGGAFHPLRRASSNNILMCQALARVYARLYNSGNDQVKALMKQHAVLLCDALKGANHIKGDIESVLEILPKDLRPKA